MYGDESLGLNENHKSNQVAEQISQKHYTSMVQPLKFGNR